MVGQKKVMELMAPADTDQRAQVSCKYSVFTVEPVTSPTLEPCVQRYLLLLYLVLYLLRSGLK